jgi:hypothetical protein
MTSSGIEPPTCRFVVQCLNHYATARPHVTYEGFLKFVQLYTLHGRRLQLDALSFIYVYSGLKLAPVFLMLLVFTFLLVGLGNPPCLLSLVKTLRLLPPPPAAAVFLKEF